MPQASHAVLWRTRDAWVAKAMAVVAPRVSSHITAAVRVSSVSPALVFDETEKKQVVV